MLERTLRTSPVTGIRLDPVLTSVLLAELLTPSDELWLVSAWISDVIAIDNSPGKLPVVRACIKTPLARKCKIPQENPAERLLSTARRGTIGAQGGAFRAQIFDPFRGGLLCRSCEKIRLLAAG